MNMTAALPRFHVLLATLDGVPWEGDVEAADVQAAMAGSCALAKVDIERVTHVLVRRLPTSDRS